MATRHRHQEGRKELQEGARGRHQPPGYIAQILVSWTGVLSVDCAGPHPPCPPTPSDLSQHCPAQLYSTHPPAPALWWRLCVSCRLPPTLVKMCRHRSRSVTTMSSPLTLTRIICAGNTKRKKNKSSTAATCRLFAFKKSGFGLFLQFKRIAMNWEEIGKKSCGVVNPQLPGNSQCQLFTLDNVHQVQRVRVPVTDDQLSVCCAGCHVPGLPQPRHTVSLLQSACGGLVL